MLEEMENRMRDSLQARVAAPPRRRAAAPPHRRTAAPHLSPSLPPCRADGLLWQDQDNGQQNLQDGGGINRQDEDGSGGGAAKAAGRQVTLRARGMAMGAHGGRRLPNDVRAFAPGYDLTLVRWRRCCSRCVNWPHVMSSGWLPLRCALARLRGALVGGAWRCDLCL
eukprot:5593742-Prymnesium_polylepis.2